MTRLSLAKRVTLARQHAGFTTEDALAHVVTRLTGHELTGDQVRAMESGRASVSGRLVHIAVACKVRPEWLMLHEGPMVEGGQADEVHPDDRPLSECERALLDRFRLLPPDTQRHLFELVKRLALPMDPRYRAFESVLEAGKRQRV